MESVQDISVEEEKEEDVQETAEELVQENASSESEMLQENASLESEESGNVTEEVDINENPVEEDTLATGSQGMEFTEVADTVTAKDVTNLRSLPDTTDAENIIAQLMNGETISRIGVNENTGWSQLDYNGQIVYAVSGYLTTDLTYKPPVEQGNPNRITTQDGRVIIFEDCDDYVRPKEYVNLRVEPSTSQGQNTVHCQITNADKVHRTGYSADSGWSRVEFNGNVLYVVSSYVLSAE